MRILGITKENSGVGWHRVMMPLKYMNKEYALITDTIDDEVLEKKFDVVVINRHLRLPVEQIEQWRNKYGFKLVIDNDDYWELDPFHPLYNMYQRNKVPDIIKQYIEIADVCTVTHERLADEVSKLNRNTHIIPNALPYGDMQYTDDKYESDKVRIFWAGSSTHVEDIKIIKNPMKRFAGDKRVEAVMSGYDDIPEWKKMATWYTAGGKANNRVFRFTPVHAYMEAYKHADIMVIPLVESKFNSMKSNLKVLEAAAKKIPVVCSSVDPYLNLPIMYVHEQKDWYFWLNELVSTPEMRRLMGEHLHKFCTENYSLSVINEQRYHIYKNK